MPTGQTDEGDSSPAEGGSFSAEVPSSQATLGQVDKTQPAHTGST